jgi:hypothetical protein
MFTLERSKYKANLNFSLHLSDENQFSIQLSIVPLLDERSMLKFKDPNLKEVQE